MTTVYTFRHINGGRVVGVNVSISTSVPSGESRIQWRGPADAVRVGIGADRTVTVGIGRGHREPSHYRVRGRRRCHGHIPATSLPNRRRVPPSPSRQLSKHTGPRASVDQKLNSRGTAVQSRRDPVSTFLAGLARGIDLRPWRHCLRPRTSCHSRPRCPKIDHLKATITHGIVLLRFFEPKPRREHADAPWAGAGGPCGRGI